MLAIKSFWELHGFIATPHKHIFRGTEDEVGLQRNKSILNESK
jgi:hypothetical protein